MSGGPAIAAAPALVPPPVPTPADAPPLDPGTEHAVTELMAETARLRGRPFLQPVDWEVIPLERMRAQFADSQLDEEEIALAAKVLKKFGLIPPDLDLRTALVGLLGEQVVGYYDPKVKALYALDTGTLPAEHMLGGTAGVLELNHTLVHELTHALQDQHFDLEHLIDEEALARGDLLDDEVAARLALAEGDAMMVGLDFSLPVPQMAASLALPTGMLDQLMSATLSADVPGTAHLAAAPAYLRNSLFFPYTMGFKFAVALRRERGWAGVDAAYTRVPASTEQIMHLDRYLKNDRPTPVPDVDLTEVLGSQWRAERPANMGELDVRLLMQEYLGAQDAERIGTGWDGDRLYVFSHATTGEVMIVWASVWDTPDEAAEFAQGYERVLSRRYGDPMIAVGDLWLWRTPAGEVSMERRGHWVVTVDALPGSQRGRVADRVWSVVGDRQPVP